MMGGTTNSGYGEQTFILHDSACQYHWSGVSSASIKTFRGGMATYRLGRGTERIGARQFLLLNDGQPYEITIDEEKPVESFCVFFPTGMAQRTANEIMMSDSARLDDPDGQGDQEWTFLDRVYATDTRIMARLDYIRRDISTYQGDKLWLDQQVSVLMENLVGLHSGIMTAMQRIPASRKATRDELIRRVLIAHEWIRAVIVKT